jgi:hypothetical protein
MNRHRRNPSYPNVIGSADQAAPNTRSVRGSRIILLSSRKDLAQTVRLPGYPLSRLPAIQRAISYLP